MHCCPELIGPIVYRLDITDVAGEFLAPYETRRVYIDLTPEEEETLPQLPRGVPPVRRGAEHLDERARRLPALPLRGEQVRPRAARRSGPTASRSASCRPRAGKFKLLEELLDKHATDRTLIFTADNATVYQIARRYLVPAMTNQTKPKERKAILERVPQRASTPRS